MEALSRRATSLERRLRRAAKAKARKSTISMETQHKLRSRKEQHNKILNEQKKNKDKEYEPMVEKFIGIKNDLDDKIGKNLSEQESEFEKKRRERRERSISKSMDKGIKKPGDGEDVDTDNMLGNVERKKKFESGDLDTPF